MDSSSQPSTKSNYDPAMVLQPPQQQNVPHQLGIPSSKGIEGKDEGQYRFYKDLITPAPELYHILLLNFYSAEIVSEKVKIGTTKTASGKDIADYQTQARLRRIPDSKRQCAICMTIKDDADFEICKGESAKRPHKAEMTNYMNWLPILTAAGFTWCASTVMANMTSNIGTGNLPSENKSKDTFKKRIIGLAHYIDEVLYEHQDEYVNHNIYLSVGSRTTLEATIINNVLSFASGSQGGHTMDRITKQTSVTENITTAGKSNDSGIASKVSGWWHL